MGDVVRIEAQESDSLSAPEPDAWDLFWTVYPRKEAKKDAKKAWAKISPSLHDRIITAAYHWRKEWIRQNREISLIPLPATWLNGERWEDEIPSNLQAAHIPAKLPDAGKRTEMPQYVKDFIASMRKR